MNKKSKSTLEKLERKLRFQNYAETTIKTYVSYSRMFLNHFNQDVYHISVKDAKHFLENYKYTSRSQQNQIISSVTFLYSNVAGSKLKTLNIKRPRKHKKLPRITDATKLALKIHSIENLKHKAILAIGLSCGLRISEVVNLKWKHLNRNQKVLTVFNGKGGKDRNVKLTEGMIDILLDYWRVHRSEVYVFNGQNSMQYSKSSIGKIFKRYISKNESYHFLRHNYGTFAIDNGTPLPVLQKTMGHSSPTTTEIYVHLSNKSLEQMRTAI